MADSGEVNSGLVRYFNYVKACRDDDFFSTSRPIPSTIIEDGEGLVHMKSTCMLSTLKSIMIMVHTGIDIQHDWDEAVVVRTFKHGKPFRVSVSAHGKWIQKLWKDVPRHLNHPKIVYHKKESPWNTVWFLQFTSSSFRFAKSRRTEKCDSRSKLRGTRACWGVYSREHTGYTTLG